MQDRVSGRASIDKKTEILRCAKSLFSEKGFKNTNISDITKMAGIASGTFYLYYASKDQLFMDIFLDENIQLKKKIIESVDMDGDPFIVINEIIKLNINGMNSNPILREWYNRDVFNKIEQNFLMGKGLEHLDFLYDCFIDIINKWQTEGKMRADIDSEMIMAMFTAIINLDMHKDEIGFQYFPDIQSHLIECVMKCLTVSSNLVD